MLKERIMKINTLTDPAKTNPIYGKTNPICCGYAVVACSSATLLTYSGQALSKTVCSSFRLPVSTANLFRATNTINLTVNFCFFYTKIAKIYKNLQKKYTVSAKIC